MKTGIILRQMMIAAILFGCSQLSIAQTTTLFTVPGVYTYTVVGASTISVDMEGAKGGTSHADACRGGYGGRIQCTMNVTPGQILQVNVGGAGGSANGGGAGGTNGGGGGGTTTLLSGYGGGGGGGASDIRTGLFTLSTRAIVAAGGGGGGDNCTGDIGGSGGGTSGSAGTAGCGADGVGGGGTPTTFGAGGTYSGNSPGTPGAFGIGGAAATTSSTGTGGGGGAGWWGGGSGVWGPGGGGSSYTDPAQTSNVTNSAGANTTGNGYVTIITLCGSTGTIVGNATVCTGVTTLYTNPTGGSGGTWTSSNPDIATVNLNSGAVTGLMPGSSIITYNVNNPCGGAGMLASQSITVNLSPTITTPTPVLCTGAQAFMSGSPTGGAWSSSNTNAASITALGTLTGGLVIGNATITYTTSSTGCFATNPLIVNLSPNSNTVTQTGFGYCAGAGSNIHIGLNGSTSGISYTLYNGVTPASTLPGTGNALDFGILSVPGFYNVIATGTTGCNVTMAGVANISINPNPSAITGPKNICSGTVSALGSAPAGGTWTSNNISIASVDAVTGVLSGVSAGTLSVTYTVAGGCQISAPVTVNTTPLPIAGQTTICSGSNTSLTSATTGGTWISSNTSLVAVSIGNGFTTGLSAGTATISYILNTGCMATTPLVVNLLPVTYLVTGGGGYCNGIGTHIGLSYSNSGYSYQLYNGATLVSTMGGSNSGLDFGLQYTPGNSYTVFAVNTITGCGQTMSGTTTVVSNPPPNTTYVVGGGGSYCDGGTGVNVSLSNSDINTSYQLVNGGPTGAPIPGIGDRLDFGPQTVAGNYTVVATTAAGCTGNTAGNAVVAVQPSPALYPLSAGGSYCAGGAGVDISVLGSDLNTKYQLVRGSVNIGAPVSGTGSPVNFGLKTVAGNYGVVATSNLTGCSRNMTGVPSIAINPLPTAYTITGGGSYCEGSEGTNVGLSFSDAGFSYQLYNGGVSAGAALPGSSSGLTFGAVTNPGVYTIAATNAITGCTSNMSGSAAVTVKTAPVPFTVTGGGAYCASATGAHVGLAGSATGVHYQLYNTGIIAGTPVTGSGSALDFGSFTAAGSYTVVATNTTSGCTSNMPGSAIITTNSLPTAYSITTTSGSTNYCAGSAGVDIQLNNSDVGTNYQLYRGILPVGSMKPGTNAALDFGFSTLQGIYTIVGNNPSTTCSSNMAGSEAVTVTPVPNVYMVTGGGNFCAGGSGVHVSLNGSNTGINYQLYNSLSGAVGTAISGTGAAVDFGTQSAPGNYTVIATNASTSCTSNMSGNPAITVSAVPDPYTLSGNGTSYCVGATGSPVGLSGSATGIHYQLYNGTAAVGPAIAGTSAAITFGPHTSGTYTVVATNSTTGCITNMPGSATITVNSLPAVYPVSGGGNRCSADAGVAVSVGNSDVGVNYQLYYAGAPTSTIVNGAGGSLSLGLQTTGGIYTVKAVDATTFCVSNMTGSAVVSVISSPAIQTVTGGGNYCSGGSGRHIGIDGSGSGFNYQLYNSGIAVGGVVGGTGLPLDFGLQTANGVYTVVASPGGFCQAAMAESAVITINALPVADSMFATNNGQYCVGNPNVSIGLNNSTSGISYTLYHGPDSVNHVFGSGTSVSFGPESLSGAYSVIATDLSTGCRNTMAGSGSTILHINPLPLAYTVTGGGNYCTGGPGVIVALNGSSTNINYQLKLNGTATGTVMAGTGTALNFGYNTAVGNYSIAATDAGTGCFTQMADTVAVAVNPYLTPVFTITANPGFSFVRGQEVTFTANTSVSTAGASPAYQWYINGLYVSGATGSTFTSQTFANNDSVSCEVTSSGLCGGIKTAKGVKLTVGSPTGVQQVTATGSNIQLAPNPNKGAFTIKGSLGTTNDEEVSLEITDMVGHVVYNGKVTAVGGSINEKIQLSNTLANGMYILSLHSASGNNIFHMVIEQ